MESDVGVMMILKVILLGPSKRVGGVIITISKHLNPVNDLGLSRHHL